MRGTPSFSSSTTDASDLSGATKIAMQRACEMGHRVFVSAYLIPEAALVKAVDTTEN
jgi:hypothetical protein